jgi:hypothetical protein
VADGLEDIASHHTVCGGLVSWFFLVERGHRTNDVTQTVCDEDEGRSDDSLGVRSDVARDHDKSDGEADGLAAVTVSVTLPPILSPMVTYLTSQNPMSRGQIIWLVKGRKAIRAVPKTQTKFPIVIINNRVLAHRVATRPAMMREMTWRDRPAQSRRAALIVENPRPLMMEPEKLVRTPLGTDEPNMAMVKSQLNHQTPHDVRAV